MGRRLARDTAIFSAAALLMAALQAIYRVVAASHSSLAAYGRAATALAIFNALLVVAHFGVPVACARLGPRLQESGGMRALLAAGLRAVLGPTALTTVVFAASTWLVLRDTELAIVAATGMAPMAASFVISGVLRGGGRVVAAAAIQPANALAQLVALAAVVLAENTVSAGAVVCTFIVGNWVALGVASACAMRAFPRGVVEVGTGDPEIQTRRLLGFGVWLTLGSSYLYILGLAPRLALLHASYASVAVIDIALLMYTVPQRLVASMVTALIPLAARDTRATRFVVIGAVDTVALAALAIALGSLLWFTDAVSGVLDAVGLSAYASSADAFVILLVAAPAEILFGYLAALLQAAGESRAFAGAAGWSVALGFVFVVLGAAGGVTEVAVGFALTYWVLFGMTLRAASASGLVGGTSAVVANAFRRLRLRLATA